MEIFVFVYKENKYFSKCKLARFQPKILGKKTPLHHTKYLLLIGEVPFSVLFLSIISPQYPQLQVFNT